MKHDRSQAEGTLRQEPQVTHGPLLALAHQLLSRMEGLLQQSG